MACIRLQLLALRQSAADQGEDTIATLFANGVAAGYLFLVLLLLLLLPLLLPLLLCPLFCRRQFKAREKWVDQEQAEVVLQVGHPVWLVPVMVVVVVVGGFGNAVTPNSVHANTTA